MSDDAQYRPNRRIDPTPRVTRVGTASEVDELARQRHIEKAVAEQRPKKKFELKAPTAPARPPRSR